MLFLLLLTAGLVTTCVAVIWPRGGGSPGASGHAAARSSGSAPSSERPTPQPARASAEKATSETLEGILVSQLHVGEITRRQYRRAMEGLAARDAQRHPLEVPSHNS